MPLGSGIDRVFKRIDKRQKELTDGRNGELALREKGRKRDEKDYPIILTYRISETRSSRQKQDEPKGGL